MPISVRASRTSSSLNGLMMAMMSFTGAPFAIVPRDQTAMVVPESKTRVSAPFPARKCYLKVNFCAAAKGCLRFGQRRDDPAGCGLILVIDHDADRNEQIAAIGDAGIAVERDGGNAFGFEQPDQHMRLVAIEA